MNPEVAKCHRPAPFIFQYDSRDAIIYALGIGGNVKQDFHFLYEKAQDFQVFPTFAVGPALLANPIGNWPGIEFDLTKSVHGEQFIEVLEPFPVDGAELSLETRLLDIMDKGSAAVVLSEVTIYNNENDKKLASVQFVFFQSEVGNFGGKRISTHEIKALKPPERKADRVMEERVGDNQAALYRLGGFDVNPLHIDKEFANNAGFQQPILHGLCTLGIVTKQILREYGAGHASNFRAVKVRFSSPVFAGQTLSTEVWVSDKEQRVYFQTKVKETGKVVLSNGYIQFNKLAAKAHVNGVKV